LNAPEPASQEAESSAGIRALERALVIYSEKALCRDVIEVATKADSEYLERRMTEVGLQMGKEWVLLPDGHL
jgi:hypothetical protein